MYFRMTRTTSTTMTVIETIGTVGVTAEVAAGATELFCPGGAIVDYLPICDGGCAA